MAQWSNDDTKTGMPTWAGALVKKTPNTANRDAMFQNTTASAFVTGQTVGLYGVDAAEMAAGANGAKVAHSGIILRRVGSGGRSGRVQTEVLVAGGMTPDYKTISLTINASANGTTLLTLSGGSNTSHLSIGHSVTNSSNTDVVNTGVAATISSIVNSSAIVISADQIIANGTCTVDIVRSTDDTIFPDS